jgi:hypothetical protein
MVVKGIRASGAHEAGVGLTLRRGVDHLRGVVAGAAGGHGVGGDDAWEADAAEVDGRGLLLRGEHLVVPGVVAPEVLGVELVAAVHGDRLAELLFGHWLRAALRGEVRDAVRRDGAGIHEARPTAAATGLLGRESQQVEGAVDVDLMGQGRVALAAAAEHRGEMEDLDYVESLAESIERGAIADVSGEALVARATLRWVKLPQIDRHDRWTPCSALRCQCLQ